MERTSADYQWKSTVQLGRKWDSENASYPYKMTMVPLPSSSAPWGITNQRGVNVGPGQRLLLGLCFCSPEYY